MTESRLSKYKIERSVPKNIVRIPTFLEGDFERDFLEEYNGISRADFRNADVLLNVLRNGKGSNPFAVVLANQVLRQVKLRTATPADIEKILRNKDLDLKGVYVDTGLVLRSEDSPNEYLARDLKGQLGNQELPVMIPLAELDLRVDSEACYGLAFDVREDAEVIYDKILNSESAPFSSEDINEKTGLPKRLGRGDRYFYTRNSELSWFYLGGDSNLYSYYRNLDNSNVNGRVVVVGNE